MQIFFAQKGKKGSEKQKAAAMPKKPQKHNNNKTYTVSQLAAPTAPVPTRLVWLFIKQQLEVNTAAQG